MKAYWAKEVRTHRRWVPSGWGSPNQTFNFPTFLLTRLKCPEDTKTKKVGKLNPFGRAMALPKGKLLRKERAWTWASGPRWTLSGVVLKQTKEHKKCNWLGHAPTKGKLISYVLWFVFLSVQEQFDPSGIKHKCAWTERVVGSPWRRANDETPLPQQASLVEGLLFLSYTVNWNLELTVYERKSKGVSAPRPRRGLGAFVLPEAEQRNKFQPISLSIDSESQCVIGWNLFKTNHSKEVPFYLVGCSQLKASLLWLVFNYLSNGVISWLKVSRPSAANSH